MKKNVIIAMSVFFMTSWQMVYAEAVSVVVPKKYLIEKASLVLYILDESGNQCVGTCQLHEAFEQRNISQRDLCIQREDIVMQLSSDSVEIVHSSQPRDNEVVLHIEFDNDVRVLRILIVKDNLLADDPFDVVTVSIDHDIEEESCDDFDALTDLIDGIDSSSFSMNSDVEKKSLVSQYALYAKIYCMMQYNHARRNVNKLTAWLCKKG